MAIRFGIATALLHWYAASARALPWREPERAGDPYAIWISEVMLQQTQVAVVLRYYERFLARFPAVTALAAAQEAEVLALWSGLGYYRRARQLHRAAQRIVVEFEGRIPARWDDLRALPGIGHYTAGAILSIAFGQPFAAVDGNVARIVSRLKGAEASAAQAEATVMQWLPASAPSAFNQALMDLGATVCLPARPHCEACPILRFCRSRGEVERTSAPRRREVVEESYALYHRRQRGGERVWLRQRPATAAILAGMWELPEAPIGGELLGVVNHSITFRKIRARVVRPLTKGAQPPEEGKWMRREEALAAPLTGLTRKALRRFLEWG